MGHSNSQTTQRTSGGQVPGMLRVVLAALAYLGFGIGAPFVGLALPFLGLLGGSKLERRKRCQRFVGGGFRFFHAYMRLVGLIHYNPKVLLPRSEGPRVVVANHPTLVDVTAVLSAEPEMCCLVKSTIYDSPLFFLIMKFCGHVRVNRSDAADGAQVIELASQRIEEGSSVLLFPEGTRSPVGEVGTFFAGAFAVAVHCEVNIAKLRIICDPPVLKRGSPWYLIPPQPVTLQVEFLGEGGPTETETIQTFRNRVREEIADSKNL